jgi:hypothetical protein
MNEKFVRLTSITGDYRRDLMPVFQEILANDYRGRITDWDGNEESDNDSILVSFTYPWHPSTGCGRDGQVYLFVHRCDVEVYDVEIIPELNAIRFFDDGSVAAWSYQKFEIGQLAYISDSDKEFIVVEVDRYDMPIKVSLTHSFKKITSRIAYHYYLDPKSNG